MNVTLADILPAIYGPAGVIVMFVVIAIFGMRGDWAWGREVRERDIRISDLVSENRELRQVAYRSVLTGEEARVLARRLADGLSDAATRAEEPR
jgi:hypothetical protein